MNDKINPVDIYAKAISEQVRRERGYVIEESHSEAQKTVEKKEKIGVGHVASHGTHHVFSPEDSSTNDDHIAYIHHDTATGKNHHILLDTKKHSVASVHKQMNKAVPGGVHKDLAKKVADAHNEDFEHDD